MFTTFELFLDVNSRLLVELPFLVANLPVDLSICYFTNRFALFERTSSSRSNDGMDACYSIGFDGLP